MSDDVSGTDWTSQELDLVVGDYFDMLRKEQAHDKLNKTAHRRTLMERVHRSNGSIEFKHQNISAVLTQLGLPRINGYKPAWHFQDAIADAIGRYLQTTPEPVPFHVPGNREAPAIYVTEPPAVPQIPEAARRAVERVARKFDPALRDERNRALGLAGEESVYEHEQRKLFSSGHQELARKVRWVSQKDGDGLGYDILSFTASGEQRLIEVKTTRGGAVTPFYLTRNEADVAHERPKEFRIFRLYDFSDHPKLFELAPPLDGKLRLEPLTYRASLR